MKSNTVVKIDNKLKNKGITFTENASLEDISQAWCYLTRFIIDIIEDKSKVYGLEENNEGIIKENKIHFAELLAEWIVILNEGDNENEK
jgi:hypothetical protein